MHVVFGAAGALGAAIVQNLAQQNKAVRAVVRDIGQARKSEYRLRYDEAGKFFIKEMELKRRYREEKNSSGDGGSNYNVVRNGWLRRNLSLTGVYYHLSRYGEDLLRPTVAGITIVFLSTLLLTD